MRIATFYAGGDLWKVAHEAASEGVVSLQKKHRWHLLQPVAQLLKITRSFHPHIVHGYMPLANLASLLAAKTVGAKVVWGLRASDLPHQSIGHALFQLEALLSPLTAQIIANSEAGRRWHAQSGYRPDRIVVIENGIDTTRFYPDRERGLRFRNANHIPEGAFVIGLPARLDPVKDHPTFLRAAAMFSRTHPNAWFSCVGGGSDTYQSALRGMCKTLELDRVSFTGPTRDMLAAYNSFDISTNASTSEGFSNTIAESMACGIPCVASDVGDSRRLIDGTGFIFHKGSASELVAAWAECSRAISAGLSHGQKARHRIVQHFEASLLADRTAEILERLVLDSPLR